MALDYSRLTDDELDALSRDDYSKLSDATLKALSTEAAPVTAQAEGNLAATAAQTAAGATLNMGATGLKELGQAGVQAAKPLAQAALGPTAAAYRASPILAPAVDAIGLATVGVPPIAASQGVVGLYDKYKGAVEGAKEISKFTSQGAPVTGAAGSVYPETVPDFRAMQRADPAAAAKLTELYRTGGGNNAVQAWLTSAEGQAAMKNPQFAAAAQSYMGKVPGAMAQVGRVAGPILRGAARVAGPVGMGMNMYDASQMAQQTQLGDRLAAGQGQLAQQAFRAGPVQNYSGPELDAAQAQAVLQSGSQRDINYFGGQQRLTDMIRRKAAEMVLGPIAPGTF